MQKRWRNKRVKTWILGADPKRHGVRRAPGGKVAAPEALATRNSPAARADSVSRNSVAAWERSDNAVFSRDHVFASNSNAATAILAPL